jgi:hypothetical protein
MADLGASFANRWQADVILIADCVWLEELVSPLLSTIERYVVESQGQVEVVISYQQRGKKAHDEFHERLNRLFSSITNVDLSAFGLKKSDCLFIYECRVDP